MAVQRHHQNASLHVIVALDAHFGQLELRVPAVVGRIDAGAHNKTKKNKIKYWKNYAGTVNY